MYQGPFFSCWLVLASVYFWCEILCCWSTSNHYINMLTLLATVALWTWEMTLPLFFFFSFFHWVDISLSSDSIFLPLLYCMWWGHRTANACLWEISRSEGERKGGSLWYYSLISRIKILKLKSDAVRTLCTFNTLHIFLHAYWCNHVAISLTSVPFVVTDEA